MSHTENYSSSFRPKRFMINEKLVEDIADKISDHHVKPLETYRDCGFPDTVSRDEAFIDEKFVHCAGEASMNLYQCLHLYRERFNDDDPKRYFEMSQEQLYETLIGLLLVERAYNQIIVVAVMYAVTGATLDIGELYEWREKVRQLIIELKAVFHKPVFEYRMYPNNRDLYQIECTLNHDAKTDTLEDDGNESNVRYPAVFTQLLTRPCWPDANTEVIKQMLNESHVFPNHTVTSVKRMTDQIVVHTPIQACHELKCNVVDDVELYEQIEICMYINQHMAWSDKGWQHTMKPYIPAPAITLPQNDEKELFTGLQLSPNEDKP